jgi:hypothetical protein
MKGIPMRDTLQFAAICAAVFLAAVFILLVPARAHHAPGTPENPLGWAYGLECCHLLDCRPIHQSDIEETAQGYVIKITGEVIPYGDRKIKQSKDEDFHHCTRGGKPEGETICLYVPNRGF